MTTKEAVALLERYSNYDGMGIQNLAGCKEAMRVAVDALKEACPELCESEDERIRRTLVEYFGPKVRLNFVRGIPIQKIRDWLEKQKEQKPEHFELRAGKWYICHRAFCCRADHLTVKEGERFMCEKDGVVKGFVIKEPEKYFKECSAPAPMEDEQKEQKPWKVGANAYFTPEQKPEPVFKVGDKIKLKSKPKYPYREIVDIKNGAYYFDEAVYLPFDNQDNWEKEQKPADDKAFEEWIDDWWKHNKVNNPDSYNKGDEIQFDERGFKNFCRGIRNMYQQKPAEWSEEDEDFINMLILHFNYLIDKGGDSVETYKSYIEKLKSLRPQPKQEWSEKERKMLAVISYKISQHQGNDERSLFTPDEAEFIGGMEDKLKSLKPSWKPSEEQMEALKDAVRLFKETHFKKFHYKIESLYEQLKKL